MATRKTTVKSTVLILKKRFILYYLHVDGERQSTGIGLFPLIIKIVGTTPEDLRLFSEATREATFRREFRALFEKRERISTREQSDLFLRAYSEELNSERS